MKIIYNTENTPLYLKNIENNNDLSGNIFYYDKVNSTMDIGRDLIRDNKVIHGDVILAEKQSGGRGRRGRAWSSPDGGLWLTMVIKPNLSPDKNPLLALVSAVSVVEAINNVCSVKSNIKWPNDILVNNKKLCGIALDLVFDERFKPWILLGIGINVNVDVETLPEEVKSIATSIKYITGSYHDRSTVLIELIKRLIKNMTELESDQATLISKWKEYDITLGNRIEVKPASKKNSYFGQAIDIDDNGALIVRNDNNELKTIYAADVSVRIK